MAASLAGNIFANVDYTGLLAIAAPILIALFGVVYRMGALDRTVKDVKDDTHEMRRDIKEIQRTMMGLPRRREDMD